MSLHANTLLPSTGCQSANPINNYCGSASANSQSAHLSARALQSAQALVGGRT